MKMIENNRLKYRKQYFKNRTNGRVMICFHSEIHTEIRRKKTLRDLLTKPSPSPVDLQPNHSIIFFNLRIFNDCFMELNLQQLEPSYSLIKLLLCSNLWKSQLQTVASMSCGSSPSNRLYDAWLWKGLCKG